MLTVYEGIQYRYFHWVERKRYKNLHPTADLSYDAIVWNKDNLVMADKTSIGIHAIIMNPKAKFIMKHHSGAAFGLSVITGSHPVKWNRLFKTVLPEEQAEIDAKQHLDRDVLVEEDVWIGANVTLLAGVTIGRGAIIGAGSVCMKDIPPYAIVRGNPAKVVGFKLTLEEIFAREDLLYKPEERLSKEMLEKNYKKYFYDRVPEINKYLKL